MSVSDYILSYPIRLRWAGFETDTRQLQQRGWSLSVDQDVYRNGCRLAMRHEQQQMVGFTNTLDLDYYRARAGAGIGDIQYLRGLAFHVVHMRSRGHAIIHEMGEPRWNQFQPIDAEPQFLSVNGRQSDLEHLVHFAPALVRTQEIILPEATVPDLMARILELQEPGRQTALKQQLMEDREQMYAIPRQKFHAQILSIAA